MNFNIAYKHVIVSNLFPGLALIEQLGRQLKHMAVDFCIAVLVCFVYTLCFGCLQYILVLLLLLE